MALLFGMHERSVRERVERYPELAALYCKRGIDSVSPDAPTEAELLDRTPESINPAIKGTDLGKMVALTEQTLLDGGYEKMGVPKETIETLRNFSSLKIDPGALLARSVTDTHHLYWQTVLTLFARSRQIYERYLDLENPKCDQGLDPMVRMFWQRAHTETVDQLGKAYDRMMIGAQAMIAMTKGQDPDKGDNAKNVTAGWGPKKK